MVNNQNQKINWREKNEKIKMMSTIEREGVSCIIYVRLDQNPSYCSAPWGKNGTGVDLAITSPTLVCEGHILETKFAELPLE